MNKILIGVVLFTGLTTALFGGEAKLDLAQVQSAVLRVTALSAEKPSTQDAPSSEGMMPEMRLMCQGSAVLIAPGLLLTCAHVVKDASDGNVSVTTTSPPASFKATVTGLDEDADIALLRCDFPDPAPTPLQFVDRMPAAGAPVYAIGYPLGDKQLVTGGIVSATGHTGLGMLPLEDFVVTDATLGHGNSGGALIDSEGKLVGMLDAVTTEGGLNKALGLAIPSSLLQAAVDRFRSGKELQRQRGFMGVRAGDFRIPLDGAGEKKVVFIADVIPGSPADAAGLRPGDVIVSVNHQSVDWLRQARTRCLACYAEGSLPITILRGEQKENLIVRLGNIESEEAQAVHCDYCPYCGCSTF